jgi:hypothetical protein
MNAKLLSSCLLFATLASAENIETIVRRNQKAALPEFPAVNAANFRSVQEKALNGDVPAQAKIPSLLTTHLKSVYGILSKQKGLLFSVRDLERGYDKAENNYAINIKELFEATTDEIHIKKRDFEVAETNGTVWQITVPTYKPDGAMVQVKKNGQAQWLALSDLCDRDRRFVENVLADEIFESSGGFDVSSVDDRQGEVENREKDKISTISKTTGEKVEGAFTSASMKGFSRRIILENNGVLPVENLVVEYQSFTKQIIMGRPKDFPVDYRCAGFFEVKSLRPGEKKELTIDLLETVDAKQETIHSGDYEFYRALPPDVNSKSEGRVNGIWVKVNRFTPYGERLIREYKSGGVPSVDWENVAPTGADIR